MTEGPGKGRACLACRAMHVRCDGRQPVCARCESRRSQCVYTSSLRGQRGGRRKKPPQIEVLLNHTSTTEFASTGILTEDAQLPPTISGMTLTAAVERPEYHCSTDLTLERSIAAYYNTVHRSHPFIVPYKEYKRDRDQLPSSLKMCMAYAASPYTSSDRATARSKALVVMDPSQPRNVFRLQALLLLVITSYACYDRQLGMHALEIAVGIATNLGLGSESFANNSTLVQRESYRRTYWQLYIITVMISTVSGFNRVFQVNGSRMLPCNDESYEDCIVSSSGTFDQLQARHLDDFEAEWSSFAYLVHGASILAQVLASDMDSRTNPGSIVERLDARITAFHLSLPRKKQSHFKDHGEIDELISMANMFVNIAGIYLHLPLSSIGMLGSFGTVCGNEHGAELWIGDRSRSYHSIQAIQNARSLTKLVIGRIQLATITPCFSCGLAFSTSTLLNALLSDHYEADSDHTEELIKLSLTALKQIGDTWQVANLVRFQLAKHYKSISANKQAQKRSSPAKSTVSETAFPILLSDMSPDVQAIPQELSVEELLQIDMDTFVESFPDEVDENLAAVSTTF